MITQYHSDAEERQVSTGIVKSLAMALDDFGDVPFDRQKFPPCWKIRWSCFLRQVQKPVSGQPGQQEAAPGCADGGYS